MEGFLGFVSFFCFATFLSSFLAIAISTLRIVSFNFFLPLI